MLHHILVQLLHYCYKEFHTAKRRGRAETEQFRNPLYNHLHVKLCEASQRERSDNGLSRYFKQCLGRNEFTKLPY